MSSSNYRYTADDGTVYQVTLPDALSIAIGNTVAGGTEPYLDATISPRTCRYRSALGAVLEVAVSTVTLFNALPNSVTIGSTVYTFYAAYGQAIAGWVPQQLAAQLIIPGPQGPAGASGTSLVAKVNLSAAQLATIANAATTLVPAQGAGTIILPFYLLIQNNGGTAAFTSSPAVNWRIGTLLISQINDGSLWSATSGHINVQGDPGIAGTLAQFQNTAVTIQGGANPTGAGTLTWEVILSYVLLTL